MSSLASPPVPHLPPVPALPPRTAVELIGLPSQHVADDAVAGLLRRLEALPPVSRRRALREAIRDREAELATLAEAHPGNPPLRDLRVDDELLNGLRLAEHLLAT